MAAKEPAAAGQSGTGSRRTRFLSPDLRAQVHATAGGEFGAAPLVAWLHLTEAPAGDGFVGLYVALAAAAAILLAVSLPLPGRRELAVAAQTTEGRGRPSARGSTRSGAATGQAGNGTFNAAGRTRTGNRSGYRHR